MSEWTKPGEVERVCHLMARRVHASEQACCDRDIRWLHEHIQRRDWYAVERLAKRLQKTDRERAFDHIDLFNNRAI